MTITRSSRRALAVAGALLLGSPLVSSRPAAAQVPMFDYKGDCLTRLAGDSPAGFGKLTVELPTSAHPDTVHVDYDFYSRTRQFAPGFRFVYSTPAGEFPIPRAAIAGTAKLTGSFDVAALAGTHRIQIVVAFEDTEASDTGYGIRLTCETALSVTPFTTTTFPQKTKKLVIPGGATPKNGSTAVLNVGAGGSGTTLPTPTLVKVVPTLPPKVPLTTTTVLTATTTTVGVATTVTPTTAPTATATTTTPATTTPATTATSTPSSTAPPVTVAAAANNATTKAKAKRTVKKRKSTKKTRRPTTTVKR